MPRALWWSYGGWLFLMSEVPLYRTVKETQTPRTLQGHLVLKEHPPPRTLQ
jgi:hypothetical protein